MSQYEKFRRSLCPYKNLLDKVRYGFDCCPDFGFQRCNIKMLSRNCCKISEKNVEDVLAAKDRLSQERNKSDG